MTPGWRVKDYQKDAHTQDCPDGPQCEDPVGTVPVPATVGLLLLGVAAIVGLKKWGPKGKKGRG